MKCDNALFTTADDKARVIGGMSLPEVWWSRGYEYAWARAQIGAAREVADMGAGWMGRPFTAELGKHCEKVWAVDLDPRLKELPEYEHVEYVVGDFTAEYLPIPCHSLDAVFCISVLEDLEADARDRAWWEWRRLLKPGGRVIFTCDAPFDIDKPCPKYPGIDPLAVVMSAWNAGFTTGDVMIARGEDTVRHDEWNLCCFHGVAVLK